MHKFDGREVAAHVLIAEKALGHRLPPGVIVHHVNESRLDNGPGNLVVCTRAYHVLLHARMRALAACGNPDWRKCSICKRYDSPERLKFGPNNILHPQCKRDLEKARYHRKKEIA